MAKHPFSAVNSGARRMRPIQLAMTAMVQSDPGLLLELMRQVGTFPCVSSRQRHASSRRHGFCLVAKSSSLDITSKSC